MASLASRDPYLGASEAPLVEALGTSRANWIAYTDTSDLGTPVNGAYSAKDLGPLVAGMSQVQQRAMGGTPEQRGVAQQVQSIFDSATREGVQSTYYGASQIEVARDAISAALDGRPLPASTDYITAPTLLTPAATDFNTVNLEGVTVTANREADTSFFGSVGDRLVQGVRQRSQWVDDAIAGANQWIDKAETSIDHARGSLRDWSMQNGGAIGGAIGNYVSDQIGFAEGFSISAAHAVTGTVSLAVSASDLVNPVTWALDSQRNIDRVKSTYRTIDTLNSVVDVTRWLTNPQQSLANTRALVDGFTQEYGKDLAAGDLPKAFGRGIFEVGSAVTPFLAGKLGKVETAARAADEAAASARAAEEAASAGANNMVGSTHDVEDSAHSSKAFDAYKRDLIRQEVLSPGDTTSGPVVLTAPEGATSAQVAQIREYAKLANLAIDEGYMSPTGRISTMGQTRRQASRAAELERKFAEMAGTPYEGVVGHVPDTTWSARPKAPFWQDLDPSINSSLGGQAGRYPIGYKPTRFIFVDDL
ncbi:hypothetical protein [Luteibacter sp. 22Crub2.1]|uniref:hypothetical protein n=1 Tax=Luteibacter sp. 22Crub2.1 TaxID=1283288 RepID=UPI0011176B1C|nr:hypothetical protein [Luteibacter sp. 22Crub2.1]